MLKAPRNRGQKGARVEKQLPDRFGCQQATEGLSVSQVFPAGLLFKCGCSLSVCLSCLQTVCVQMSPVYSLSLCRYSFSAACLRAGIPCLQSVLVWVFLVCQLSASRFSLSTACLHVGAPCLQPVRVWVFPVYSMSVWRAGVPCL